MKRIERPRFLWQGDDPQKFRLEEGDGTRHAQRIVRELYLRYEKQLQRWKDYRNLFVFLGFVALFLAVLYLQRNADIAYKVHSTVESVVVPEDDVMQNTDEVYQWLNDLLTVSVENGKSRSLEPLGSPHARRALGARTVCLALVGLARWGLPGLEYRSHQSPP